MMSQLGKRLISSAFFVSATLFTIFIAPDWFFLFFVQAFIVVGLWEYFTITAKSDLAAHKEFGVLFGALIPLAFYFRVESLALMLAVLSILVYHFRPSLKESAIRGTALTVFGVVYIAWFCSFLIHLRNLPHGPAWVFYLVLLVKGGDAGAYFVGKKYGKKKLIEHISPNKSVEGALGGLAVTVLLSLISFTYLSHVPFFHLFVLGILISVLSQLGDLAESVIKRNVGVKDSGAIPGLGGILDILDSLILTIPFAYYYIMLAIEKV